MHFHTLAYTGTVTTAQGLIALGVTPDTVFSPSGSGYLAPEDMRVMAAFAAAEHILRARVNAPSLLRVGYPSIRPVQQSATTLSGTATADPNMSLLTDSPTLIRAGEAVGIEAATVATGGETVVGLLWLAAKIVPAPKGESFWLRFTSSTQLSALAWKVLTPTFDQSLPSGAYAILGMEFTSPGAVAARAVLPGSVMRPGVIAQVGSIAGSAFSAGAARTHAAFYDGTFGVFGVFQTSAPPNIEVFSISADAANTQEGYLRVMRIGDVGSSLSGVSALVKG